MDINKEIKDSLKGKKLTIGTRSALKLSRQGLLKTIIHSSNIPESLKKDLDHYSKSGIEINAFDGDSVKLGQRCGKPFKILIIGIKK